LATWSKFGCVEQSKISSGGIDLMAKFRSEWHHSDGNNGNLDDLCDLGKLGSVEQAWWRGASLAAWSRARLTAAALI
jgi:hypothetical protein